MQGMMWTGYGMRLGEVDAKKIWRSAAKDLVDEVTHRKLIFKEYFFGDPKIYADQDNLKEVFKTLIQNSLESVSGDRTTTIQVRFRRVGNLIEIRYDDNGPGLSSEKVKHVFSPDSNVADMALVRKIIHRHGGTISVERKYSSGVRYCIQMPGKKEEGHRPPPESRL